MDSSFERLIESLRKASTSKSSQGTMMERLMKQFLLVSPLYSRVYDKVWLWSDFPYNGNITTSSMVSRQLSGLWNSMPLQPISPATLSMTRTLMQEASTFLIF